MQAGRNIFAMRAFASKFTDPKKENWPKLRFSFFFPMKPSAPALPFRDHTLLRYATALRFPTKLCTL
jgi:hypothetical protein